MRSKRRKQKRKTAAPSKSAMQTLLASAAAIPSLAAHNQCLALDASQQSEVRFAYMYYRDFQAGSEDRMKVHAPMAWFRTPAGEHTEIEGNFVLDSVSGASPLYHDTLSGASGRGIEDQRTAANLSVSHYFKRAAITAGISNSDEDDYDSTAGSLELKYWTPSSNTIVTAGFSGGSDSISSTNDPSLDESQDTLGAGAGITQVLDKNSLIQSNITFGSEDGYLTDPYKTFDLRPRSRDQLSWLTRYVLFIEEHESSLHFDYRLYTDSWGINAHTFEIQYYQPFGSSWLLRPRLRYYTQDKADFYSSKFPPDQPGLSFYSADQRLSGFGSISAGLRLERAIAAGVYGHISFDYIRQEGGLKAFSPGSPDLEAFNAYIIGVGMLYTF